MRIAVTLAHATWGGVTWRWPLPGNAGSQQLQLEK